LLGNPGRSLTLLLNGYDAKGYNVDIDVEDDVYYSPFVYPFYGWDLYGADVDVDDGELEMDLD
jgi:hypothetical protein